MFSVSFTLEGFVSELHFGKLCTLRVDVGVVAALIAVCVCCMLYATFIFQFQMTLIDFSKQGYFYGFFSLTRY